MIKTAKDYIKSMPSKPIELSQTKEGQTKEGQTKESQTVPTSEQLKRRRLQLHGVDSSELDSKITVKESSLTVELRKYDTFKFLDSEDFNVYNFWQKNEKEFPLLTPLVKKILSSNQLAVPQSVYFQLLVVKFGKDGTHLLRKN
jgi:hypothetical protein